jgi:hypothetical protein
MDLRKGDAKKMTAIGILPDKSIGKPFQRRGDIIDPTALLGRLASHVLESHAGFAPNASAGGVE